MSFLGAIKEQQTKDKCKRTSFVFNNCPTVFRLGTDTSFRPLKSNIFVPPSATVWTFKCPSVVFTPTELVFPDFKYIYYTWGPTIATNQGISKITRDEGNEPNWSNALILQTALETSNLDSIAVDESAGFMFILATTAQFRNLELRRYPLAPSSVLDYTVLIQDTDLINGLLAGGLSIDRINQRLFVLSGPLGVGSGLIAEYTYDGTYVQTITTHTGALIFLSGCGYDGQEYIYYKVGQTVGDNHLWRVSVDTLAKEELIVDNVPNSAEVYIASASSGYLVTINYSSRDIRANTIPTLGAYNTIANGGAVGSVGLAADWKENKIYYPASFIGREPVTGASTEVVASSGSGIPLAGCSFDVAT